jgi:major membrane immunogen (membrane-anchored lipoprotein)
MKNIGIAVVAIILLLIVAVGGVFFLKSSKAPATSQTKSTNTQTAKPTAGNATSDSILSLISGGKTVNCSITYPDNKGTGNIYVSDKKFAGDFTTKDTSGKETAGHMISDGTFMYIWSAAMPTGIKVNLENTKNMAQNSAVSRSFDVNQKVGLNCSPWLTDNSKFTVPTNIKFQDMSELLKQFQPQVTTAPATGAQTDTSACDQVPAGAARTACENALQSSGN